MNLCTCTRIAVFLDSEAQLFFVLVIVTESSLGSIYRFLGLCFEGGHAPVVFQFTEENMSCILTQQTPRHVRLKRRRCMRMDQLYERLGGHHMVFGLGSFFPGNLQQIRRNVQLGLKFSLGGTMCLLQILQQLLGSRLAVGSKRRVGHGLVGDGEVMSVWIYDIVPTTAVAFMTSKRDLSNVNSLLFLELDQGTNSQQRRVIGIVAALLGEKDRSADRSASNLLVMRRRVSDTMFTIATQRRKDPHSMHTYRGGKALHIGVQEQRDDQNRTGSPSHCR